MNGFISRFNENLSSSPKLINKKIDGGTEQRIIDFISGKVKADPNRESFFVMNTEDIVAKHQTWVDKLPRVRPYYSVKANNSTEILGVLSKLGIGFDCVSEFEMNQVLPLIADPKKDIIYANPVKPINDLKYSKTKSIDLMTFDNEDELTKIAEHYPTARLVIRLRVEDEKSIQPFGEKYGCILSEVSSLLGKAFSLGLNVVGVSFHVGCRCSDANAFAKAIIDSKGVFDLAHKQFGYKFNVLNIGGGFPGASWHISEGDHFAELAKAINQSLNDHFPEKLYKDLQVIAEPGTYYCSSAFSLAVKVVGKRVDTISGTKHIHYYINDGVFGSLFGPLWGYPVGKATLPIKLLDNRGVRPKHMSTIWGETLASLDVVAKDIEMSELMVNEWFVFTDVGDYSVCLITGFCGFNAAKIFTFEFDS